MTLQKKAFTLIELLVVIAIIALLVSILMPSLRRAKVLAIRVQCNANLHAIQSACALYANDFNEDFPSRNNKGSGAGQEASLFRSSPHVVASGSKDAGMWSPGNPDGTTPILFRIFFKTYLTGEKDRAMYCPGLLKYKNNDNYGKQYISYAYYNFPTPAQYKAAGDSVTSPWTAPYQPDLSKVSTAKAGDPMWGCLTYTAAGSTVPTLFHDYDNMGQYPEGMNCARAGGSSDWVQWPGLRLPIAGTATTPSPDAIEPFNGTSSVFYWPTTKY